VLRVLATAAACLALAQGAALAATGPATPTQSSVALTTSSVFLFSGHGWGHGLGMSQYGALGYAQHGLPYDQILAHYYPGTALQTLPPRVLRVLLLDKVKSMPIGSDSQFTVKDATGAVHNVAAGMYKLGPDLSLPVDGSATPQSLQGPLVFSPGASPLRIVRTWRGSIQVTLYGTKLQAIDLVGLEDYLKGVVPSEVPSTWPTAALEAQAVAARSYALASVKGAPYAFDLYSDTRSQAYGGVKAESAAATAAVIATRGRTLVYDGKPALAMFFSSSGGRTESAADVYASTAQAPPYLVSVDDPWDVLSPYHNWGPVPVAASKVGKALKVPGTLVDLTTTLNPAGRVATASAVGTRGSISVTGSQLRASLGLRSTWFDIGVLSLARPTGPVVYGATVALSGLVRGASATGATLESQPAGGAWQPLTTIAPLPDGTFSTSVAPTVTTTYRLELGTVNGPSVRIPVAPSVTLDPVAYGQTTVSGRISPVTVGSVPQVQQSTDAVTWTTVAAATLDSSGAFVAAIALQPGSWYRVVLPAGHGLAQGASPAVQAPTS
jgi:stage II sporulation protein D